MPSIDAARWRPSTRCGMTGLEVAIGPDARPCCERTARPPLAGCHLTWRAPYAAEVVELWASLGPKFQGPVVSCRRVSCRARPGRAAWWEGSRAGGGCRLGRGGRTSRQATGDEVIAGSSCEPRQAARKEGTI